MKTLKVTCSVEGKHVIFYIKNVSWYSIDNDILNLTYCDPSKGISIHNVLDVIEVG